MSTTHRPAPLLVINKLIQARYATAQAVFWAGSVSKHAGTLASDLDLVIVFDTLDQAYREAFVYEGWPIDAFVHDLETLHYVFEDARVNTGIPATLSMIVEGQAILPLNPLSIQVTNLATAFLNAGPAAWSAEKIQKTRFLITDALNDIQYPASRSEQLASAAQLFETLGQFYFRSQNKWCATGKSLMRYLKNDDIEVYHAFHHVFEAVFQTGQTQQLEALIKRILEPFGGLLWDGFSLNAPTTSRLSRPFK